MSGEPTERDVEALAKALRRTAVTRPSASWYEDIRRSMTLARAILASDWYVERIAEARREGAAEVEARVKKQADQWEFGVPDLQIQRWAVVEGLRAALRGEDA